MGKKNDGVSIVRYNNHLNTVPLRGLSEGELNLFFSILFRVRDNGDSKIRLEYKDLRKLANIKNRDNTRIQTQLDSMMMKLISTYFRIEDDNGIKVFNIFSWYYIPKKTKETHIDIQVSEHCLFLVNNLVEKFTQFELSQFVHLKSSYSKTIFRLLKQFDSTGWREIPINDFREILCVPMTYRMSEINSRILNPVLKELSPIFPELEVQKLKTGRTITSLRFTWDQTKKGNVNGEDTPTNSINKKEVEISEDLNKIIIKCKTNRFISKLITPINIQKLLKKYDDNLLVKGLKVLEKSSYEIKSLKYLHTILDEIVEVGELKFKVIKNTTSEINNNIETDIKTKEPFKAETRDPKSLEEYTEDNILKAMGLCVEKEDVTIKFLTDLKKKSKTLFIKTIEKYL